MTANQSARLTTITIGGKNFTPCLKSFQGSDNHLDQSGLISFTGEVLLGKALGFTTSLDDRANITDFCRGNAVIITVGGERHPRGALRVMGSRYDSDRQELSVQVGDLIALLNFKEPTNPDDTGIEAGVDKAIADIITNLLAKAGIDAVAGDLPDGSINYPINLSGSYLQSVGKILYSYGCFAWIDKNESFRVEKINFSASGGVSIKVGRDEIWYRRLTGSEQPCSIIKAVGSGKILRPYPKTRQDYSETYGIASTVDPTLDNFRILTETSERYETWDEDKNILTITTYTKKPMGLVVPSDVIEAVFSFTSNKTALIDYEYKIEYFYYEQDSECKLKRKQEQIYRNLGNLYREVILSASSPSSYNGVVLKLGPEQEIFTDYEYNPKGVITKVTTTTNEHILSVLNDSGEDWGEWGSLDFFVTSAIKTEEWEQIKKGTPGTWSYKISSQQALVRVKADTASPGPNGNKTALVDDGTGKYQTSNSGQLTPPAPERCPVKFTIDEINIEDSTKFTDPCESDFKPRERTYSVEVCAQARIDADDGNTFVVGDEPGTALLKAVASREGKLLFGRYKGQEIATPLYSGWFNYKPLMGISAAEPDGGVQSYLVDGASWVIGTTKALVSCDGIWTGNNSGASVAVNPSTGETIITGGTLIFPYQEIAEFSLGLGVGIGCTGYPYLLEVVEAIAPLALGLGITCTGGFSAPLGLGMGLEANGTEITSSGWDNVDWDSVDWDTL
ncbi:hypothetical protein [Anabaena sp. CCY 9910]|uniref:hypothetical protein n=1 Tax=Anabaena sp. CCY 9910 TaxID=3103870 RepID=UPI0039DF5250